MDEVKKYTGSYSYKNTKQNINKNFRDWSYDKFIITIEQNLIVVAKHMENDLYIDYIRGCKLRPCRLYEQNYNMSFTTFEKKWIDSNSNTIEFSNKSYSIKFGDLSIPKFKLINVDIYKNLSILELCKISSHVAIFKGSNIDYYQIVFLGFDKCIRSRFFINDKLEDFGPIVHGPEIVLKLLQEKSANVFKVLKNIFISPFPCKKQEEWLLSLPLNEEGKSLLKSFPDIADIFGV